MKIRLAILTICLSLILCGCAATNPNPSATEKATADSATVPATEKATATPTEKPTEAPTIEALAEKRIAQIKAKKKISPSAYIDTEEILQYPELPTGCESVALTMAINSLGYDLSKTDIAEKYMPYGDYVDGFEGDPFSDGGAGIMPPGLVTTVNNFVADTGAKLYAHDTTGTKLSDLYRFIDAGCPAVVWTTYYMDYPDFDGGYYEGDAFYPWYNNEHCVAMIGYDTDDGTVTIADPLEGISAVSAYEFGEICDEIGNFSVILLDTTDLK